MTSPILNAGADYWHNKIGANVIPANTKEKNTFENWTQWQDKPIPSELHEERKRNGNYDNGIAVMTGRLYKGQYKDKYLIGIDCDNRKAIEEICTRDGKTITLSELSDWTIVEQHKDNPNKAHIYILSTKAFKNKGKDSNNNSNPESLTQIPSIEIKCEKRIMFVSPSMHENGKYPYEMLGTRELALCDEFELHIDNIFKKYGIEYLQTEENYNNNRSSSLPYQLRQIINLLHIPQGFQYRIPEGQRHDTMLSFANSLLIKHNNNNNRDELKNLFNEVNNKICSPLPLPESEIKDIWRDALRFSQEKISNIQIINNDEDDPNNYNTQVAVALVPSDRLSEEAIVQHFIYDIRANSLECTLNSKYDLTKIIVPVTIKQWPEIRKTFQRLCGEKGISKEHTRLLVDSIDNNSDLIKKNYYDNNKKHRATIAGAEERKKQRLKLIEEGTQFVMSKYRLLTIEESKEILFYDSSKGVYATAGDIIIEKELDKKYGYNLKTADITEIKNYVIRKTYTKRESFDSNLDIINLKNGLYNWRSGELSPHTPDYYSVNQKPFSYNPKAKSRLLGKFLKEVLYPQDIRTALEIIAYTFIRINLFEYYFILIGTGANGKSVFIGILSNLHGLRNISNVPLHSLVTNRFALADLENKDVNVDTELSSSTINDMSILKKLTGRQPLRIERKGQHAHDVLLWAKQFFNANQLPRTSDNSDAHYRREIVITFPKQFEGKNEDLNLLNKLTTEEELSGIFNIIAKCLRTLDRIGKIHVNSKTISERRAKAELIRNPIKAFLDFATSKEPNLDDFETKDNLYRAFLKFCKIKKLMVIGYDEFAITLNRKHGLTNARKIIEKRKQTIWKGVKLIKFKDTDDPSQQTLTIEEEEEEMEKKEEHL
jgi:P4 family phage/plasmid primase-like protien